MRRLSILGGLAVSLFALPAMAQETVYTTATVALEAGPAPDYPIVGTFGAGTPLTLYGCLDGYNWCDVSYQDVRGWVDGQALVYPYEDQRVPIAVYGPELSLPIVSFSFDDYWEHHYHDRPFFRERDRYEHHEPPPPPRREAPPPLPGRGQGHPGEGRPGEGRFPDRGEGRPPDHAQPGLRPEPVGRPPEQRPGEARPQFVPQPHPQGEPHPQPQGRPPEPRPQVAPRPAPPPAARPPEPRPQPAPHPPEEHREPGEQPH